MKLNKIFSALFALVLAAGFTACTDEVDYTAAQKTPGYYFPVANTTSYTLEAEGGAFEVIVGRIGYTAAESVTVTCSSSDFAVTAATFAADEDLTVVTVTYPALTPGDYNFTLGFTNGTQISQYGYSELNFKTNLPAPVEVGDWIELGECTYTDPFIFAGLYGTLGQKLTYNVKLAQDGKDENHYRLYAPYGTAFAKACQAIDPTFILEDNEYDSKDQLYLDFYTVPGTGYVYIPYQLIGLTLDADGEMAVINQAANYLSRYEPEVVIEQAPGSFGILKNGIINVPYRTLFVNFPFSENFDGDDPVSDLLYYSNTAFGNMNWIVFPGVVAGDYTAEVEYTGQFNNAVDGTTTAVATVTLGEDVASAKAAIVRGSSAQNAISAITDGTYEGAVDVNINNPVVSLPMYTAGTHTIAVVTFDESGEAMDNGTVTFTAAYYANDKAWNNLGYATVADGWIVPFFLDEDESNTDYAYDVEMQESKTVAGLYRIKNMYGVGTPVGTINQSTQTTDLYIDASDPECILVMPQYSGFTFAPALGDVYIANLEGRMIDYGLTKADILKEDEDGYNNVTTWIEDGMIIIDPSFITGTGTMFGGNWYYLDTTYIILPEAEDTPADIRASHKAVTKSTINKNVFKSSFKMTRKDSSNGANHKMRCKAESEKRQNVR